MREPMRLLSLMKIETQPPSPTSTDGKMVKWFLESLHVVVEALLPSPHVSLPSFDGHG